MSAFKSAVVDQRHLGAAFESNNRAVKAGRGVRWLGAFPVGYVAAPTRESIYVFTLLDEALVRALGSCGSLQLAHRVFCKQTRFRDRFCKILPLVKFRSWGGKFSSVGESTVGTILTTTALTCYGYPKGLDPTLLP